MKPKKFKFKLQKILDLKIQEEEEQKKAFLAARKRLQEEEERLEQLINLREMKKLEMRMKMSRAELDVFEMQMYVNYIESLKRQIEVQRDVVREAQKVVERKLEKLKEKKAEREALEKLKERKYQEFLKEQELEERKFLDELASIKFARKHIEEQEGGD